VAGRALQTAPPQVVAKKRVAQPGDGYQLSEHVLRYYETIRV